MEKEIIIAILSVGGGITSKIIFDWLKGNKNIPINIEKPVTATICKIQHDAIEKTAIERNKVLTDGIHEIKETHKEIFKKIDDIWCYVIKEKKG